MVENKSLLNTLEPLDESQGNQRQADEFTDRDAAYLFAGEGYMNIAIPNIKKNYYPSLRVGVTTTEKLWADLFFARYGGFTFTGKPQKKANRHIFGWRVTGKNAEAFLRAIQPYLRGEKVPQLELMLKFREDVARFYRKAKINSQADLWKWYRAEMKNVRLAAAETNRRDAATALRSDSPVLEEILA